MSSKLSLHLLTSFLKFRHHVEVYSFNMLANTQEAFDSSESHTSKHSTFQTELKPVCFHRMRSSARGSGSKDPLNSEGFVYQFYSAVASFLPSFKLLHLTFYFTIVWSPVSNKAPFIFSTIDPVWSLSSPKCCANINPSNSP